jgi:hypothetical protein
MSSPLRQNRPPCRRQRRGYLGEDSCSSMFVSARARATAAASLALARWQLLASRTVLVLSGFGCCIVGCGGGAYIFDTCLTPQWTCAAVPMEEALQIFAGRAWGT